MKKNKVDKKLPYFIALCLLTVIFFLFNNAYREMLLDKDVAARHNKVSLIFKNVSLDINKAALLNPVILASIKKTQDSRIFYTSKEKLLEQVALLRSTVKDPGNIRMAAQLDSVLQIEWPWIMASNVPDSILHQSSSQHLASLRFIDSLTSAGVYRTNFLLEDNARKLDDAILRLRWCMIAFILLSSLLLIYTSYNLVRQRKKLSNKEKDLEHANLLLKNAQQIARIGNWECDSVTNKLHWSEEMYKIWNQDPHAFHPTKENILQLIHPDDIIKVENELRVFVRGMKELNIDHRILLKDGSELWINSRGRLVKDKAGKVIRAEGTAGDISATKTAEQKIIESEEKYRNAQRIGRMGHWEVNLSNNKLFWSDEIYNFFGLTIHTVKPDFETFLRFVHPGDRSYVLRAQKAAMEGIKPYDLVHRVIVNGATRYMHGAGELVKDTNGTAVKFAGMVQDVTEQYQADEDNRFKAELLNTIGQAVIATDLTGNITYWNKAAEGMYGWMAAEALGRNVINVTPSKLTTEQATTIMRDVNQGKVWTGEFIVQKKDGTEFPVYVTDAPVYDSDHKLCGIIGVSTDISQRKKDEETLIAANEELRTLSGYLQNIREDERKHIAREIHDELGQQLTAIKMDVSWLNKKLGITKEEHKEKIAGIFELIDNTINTVRKIAADLRPAVLDDLGLAEAIRWQLNEFMKHTGNHVHFVTNTDERIFPPEITTAIFRIFQESLTNIARHARATMVTCELHELDEDLLLTIRDNGSGFDTGKTTSGASLGLLGMKERINMLKGKYVITSEIKKGTIITVRIPLSTDTQSTL